MNTKQKYECLDCTIGNMITQFEFGVLDDNNREIFEDHLMDCEFCRMELKEFDSGARLIKTNRDSIRALILENEPSIAILDQTDNTKNSILEAVKDFGETIGFLIDSITRPRVLAPVLSIAVVVVLSIAIFNSESKYEQYLSFSSFPYHQSVFRGNVDSMKTFEKAMEYYQKGDFLETIDILSVTNQRTPEDWRVHFFLGVCYYLEKDPDMAITSLVEADSLSKFSFKSEIYWYLFQSYLLQEELTKADSVRTIIISRSGMYADSVNLMWKEIQND
jgi:hypothetical protein